MSYVKPNDIEDSQKRTSTVLGRYQTSHNADRLIVGRDGSEAARNDARCLLRHLQWRLYGQESCLAHDFD